MSFIFFLILFVIILVVVALFTVAGVLRMLFGFGRKSKRFSGNQGFGNEENSYGRREESGRKQRKSNKIFDQQEGEYIDYEDIKD